MQSKHSFRRKYYSAAIVLLLGLRPCAAYADATPKYLDPALSVEQRLDDLIPRLSLEDKIGIIRDDWGSAAVAKFKIPALLKTEGLHSQSYGAGATIYPHAIAMAATFNPDLVNQIGQQTAVEARIAGIRQSWSPVLDVARDVRWGRVEETYGEDPFLVSRMGVAWITGFQKEGMIATPKHFAVHGQPLGGRDSNDTDLSMRTIREVHLPSFRAAIEEAHAGAIMAAYSTWNGVPCNASTDLLQHVLREEWGFDGFIVSDCGGPEQLLTKHSVVATPEEAAKLAVEAGVTVECGSLYKKYVQRAIDAGILDVSAVDQSVRRVLRAKMVLGLFENPGPPHMNMDTLPGYDAPERRAIARETAVQSAVLLKNQDNLLPLKKDISTIAVIGPDADEPRMGDYSPKFKREQVLSVLQGIKAKVSPGTKVLYAQGCDVTKPGSDGFAAAVDAAKQADVVVMVVGDGKDTTGENRDGATLDLPGSQRDLIKAVAAAGKPVVLIVVNGKPFTLAWEADNLPAILVTWYAGEEAGNAAADLLFGDRNPSGRLPVTFPRSASQLPLTYDFKTSGRSYDYYDMPFTPQYRFGYGLSYTTFNYSNLKMTSDAQTNDVDVNVDVKNTGKMDGDEVAQLYLTDVVASVTTPVMQLKGFQRALLKAGESRTLHFTLSPYEMSLLDEKLHRVVEPGVFRISVGGASPIPVPNGTKTASFDQKTKIGFTNPADGVSGDFVQEKLLRARFKYDLQCTQQVQGGEPTAVTLNVTNEGDLTDLRIISLYGDNHQLDTWHVELQPGQSKTHTFTPMLYNAGPGTVAAVADDAMVMQPVKVSPAPPKLVLSHTRLLTNDAGQLTATAIAKNTGSAAYAGSLSLSVNGNVVKSNDLKLAPGETATPNLVYQFPSSGQYKMQLGDGAPQDITVAGAIGLALRDPVARITLDSLKDGSVTDAVTGAALKVKGTSQRVDVPNGGAALLTEDQNTYIATTSADLYRKPFTLAARIKINALSEKRTIGLFGGVAPMGADVDANGTQLHAGVRDGKLTMSFFGPTVTGAADVPVGQWIAVAYTYDPATETGSVYLNGKLDKSATMKPYAGPLEMIGSAPVLAHGKFALADITVLRTCLPANAVKLLSEKGADALKTAEYVSDWRPMAELPQTLDGLFDLPSGAAAEVTIDTGDGKSTTSSVKIALATGKTSFAIAGLKPAAMVRVKAKLTMTDWTAGPTIRALTLHGGAQSTTWAFAKDWQAGSASPGIAYETK